MPGYVDTNVLVRLVVRESPQQAHQALQLIRANSPVRVHSAIMLEIAFVLLRTYKRSRATVAQTLASILKSPRFVVDERAVWTLTLDRFTSTSLHLVDCHLVARAITDHMALHTLDQDLAKIVQRRRTTP
jgi:predicted nucleic-acid-binding protein